MLFTNWLNVFADSRSRSRQARVVRRARRRTELQSSSVAPLRTELLETRTLLTAPTPVSLGTLDGTNGFRITGEAPNENAGTSVAGVGDFDGDGFEDVVVSAPGRDVNGSDFGTVSLRFGTSS